ncbi:nucleoside hydrolase [Marinimicrobium koreense]|uniref:nucleoside hydrolase n=1 Tax=Marinimicrobium koreense TaxID=306545 RepID=UPI003F70D3A6
MSRWLSSLLILSALSGAVKATPVIFDNDMAIDDWAALLYLLHHPDADVRAITISASGESRCEPALRNTMSLLDLPGSVPEIPVACGDDYPLEGYFVFPEAWRKDSDTLSGVQLPASERRASSQHAVEVIHQTLQASDEDVTIVATGPLTNIAQWLERYPDDVKRVEALIIMGGTVDAPGNIIVPNFTDGHPNTMAEWNIYIDPLAADRVLAADIPTTLVGLDVTNSVRVTDAVAKDFKAVVATDSARFWDQVLDNNDWFIASGEYYFWDTLAALIAVDPGLCRGSRDRLAVQYETTGEPWWPTSDKTMPARRWDGAARSHLLAKSAGVLVESTEYPAITVCRKTQPNTVFSLFRSTLNR